MRLGDVVNYRRISFFLNGYPLGRIKGVDK